MNFTTSFTVDQTPAEVYEAILNVRGWWSEEIEGDTDIVGGEFVYQYEHLHRCRIAVTELVAGRRVTWLVLDNHFDFIADKSEWVSNAMVFDITPTDAGTQLRFTQVGLVPDYECYDVCSNAWGFYLNGSLRGLITTGQGSPNATGRANLAVEEVA